MKLQLLVLSAFLLASLKGAQGCGKEWKNGWLGGRELEEPADRASPNAYDPPPLDYYNRAEWIPDNSAE